MKTTLRFALIVLVNVIYSNLFAAVIQVSAPNNLYNFVNTMNDGDIIELTTSGGSYFWSAQVSVSVEKSITIRAKGGLDVRPNVVFTASTGSFLRYNGYSTVPTSKKWIFSGINFDGYNSTAGFYASNFLSLVVYSPNYGMNVDIDNCVFKNFSGRTIQYGGSGGTTASTIAQGGNLKILNSEFRQITTGILTTSNVLMYNPDNVEITNCLFVGPGINGSTPIYIELNAVNYNSYKIDHCTFINSNRRELYLARSASTSYIRNCLFVNNLNASTNNYYTVTLGSDCGIYYTSTGVRTSIYPFSTAVRLTNPVLNATTGIATAATYLTGTTDGLPTGFYGNQIVCTESDITDLSYTGNAGPSPVKSFNVSATRLTNSLVITPPANFEISATSSTTGFVSTPLTFTQSGGNVALKTIYVRLKAGLSDNIYSDKINISSVGAAAKQVNVSGTVTSKPTIFSSVTSLSGFTYMAGSGPSTQQMFTLNAAGLTSAVTITAPTGFEVSLNSGTAFSGSSSLNIAQISGKVNALNVYVRLKAGQLANTYLGVLSLTSVGADTKSVYISGTVTPAPVVITVSKTSLTNFTYSNGNGPSAIQSFTVNGSGLTANIKVTAPANYEVSTFNGTSFVGSSSVILTQNAGNVSVTNIYARMKKDLAVGTYDGKITVETTGATTKEVSLSGYVTEATSVSVSATSLAGFEYVVNNGPSAEKSLDIAGVNLNSYVVVTAPANYEVSTTSGAAFSGSGQILLDQASVSGQTLRIYVRLMKNLAVATYTGNLTVASSGATTKSVSMNGNVYNPLVVTTEPAYYEPRFGANYTLTNKWLFSKNTNNYTYGNELIAASSMARDMAVRNGKMVFVDRGNKRIVVVNGQTGLKESPVVLNPGLFSYVGRNVANTADSTYLAGTYQFHSIKVDNAGNVLVGNLITSNTGRFQIYKIDMATGNGTLVIDQANLANLFPLATTLRLDYFGVWGDVNSNAVILSANSSSTAMEVYKWVISNGIVGAPTVIRLDNVTLGTYLSGLESLGGYPHVFPVASDKFYVDGGGTYPTLVNTNGTVLDGFHNEPSALKDSVTVAGQGLIMNPGNNGVCEFSMGGKYFMVTSATNTTGIPSSSFRLFKFADATKSFANIDCMWTFPQAGMGIAANSYRTALPMVEVNGYTAKIYIYCGENGFGMYELNMNPLSTGVDKNSFGTNRIVYAGNELRLTETAKRIDVYSHTGQLILSANNTSTVKSPLSKGMYIVRVETYTDAAFTQKILIP